MKISKTIEGGRTKVKELPDDTPQGDINWYVKHGWTVTQAPKGKKAKAAPAQPAGGTSAGSGSSSGAAAAGAGK